MMAECLNYLEKTQDDSDSVGGKATNDKNIICQPCQEDGAERQAVKYCTECEDLLCQTCVECHQKAKPSRNHALVSSDVMPEEKQICSRKKKELCKLHEGQEIQLFCNHHEQLCCSKCIATGHSVCVGVDKIEDIVVNVENWEELKQFAGKLDLVIRKYEERLNTAKATIDRINKSAENATFKVDGLKKRDIENTQMIKQTCETVLLETRSFQEALAAAQKAQDKISVFTMLKTFANGLDFMDKNTANIDTSLEFGEYRVTRQPKKPLLIRKINIGLIGTATKICLLDRNTFAVAVNQNRQEKLILIDIFSAESKSISTYNFVGMKGSYHGKLFVLSGSSTYMSINMYPTPFKNPNTVIRIPIPFSASLVQCYKEAILLRMQETGDIVQMDYSGNIRKKLFQKTDMVHYAFDKETGSLFASGNGLKEYTTNGTVRTLIEQETLNSVRDMVYDANEFFVVRGHVSRSSVYSLAMNGDSNMIISKSDLGFQPTCLAFDSQYRLLYVGGYNSDSACIFCV